jgi:hypothetical protein
MSKILYENRWIGKVERFNQRFPPGTSVVFTGRNGVKFKTEIRYPAVVLGNGRPVIWLKNIREYCRFDRVVVTL